MENKFGDSYFEQVNGHVFDSLGSEAFYRSAYGAQLFQENTLYIFVGTDSGLLPKFIRKQGVPEHSRYVFIETNDIYEQILCLCPPESHEQNISLGSSSRLAEILADPSLSCYIHTDKNLFFESVAAKEATFFSYQELSVGVRQEWIDRIWRTKVAASQQDFIEKQLENLSENRFSSICLQGAFKGKIAVLLGGGPSLDEALPWVKENRSKLVVLAISRVCRRLREVDLVPDLVFSVDPYPINYENSVDLFYFWEKTLFVHAHHVSPQLLAQWRGKSLYSGPRFPWPTPLNEATLPLANPTVTNTAFVSAVAMGFKQVILAGVDLCHSREGFTHAKGNIEHKIGVNIFEKFVTVQTYSGKNAQTLPAYANALKELGEQAEAASTAGCKVFNTSAEAAFVETIEYRPASEILLDAVVTEDGLHTLSLLAEDEKGQRSDYYRLILQELNRGNARLCTLIELMATAIETLDSVISSSEEQAQHGQRLKQIERQLTVDLQDIFSTVKVFAGREFLQIKGVDAGPFESIMSTRNVYQVLKGGAEQLLKCLQAAEERLALRIHEEQEQIDFDRLKRQWEKDKQLGRTLVWRDQHPEQFKGMLAPVKKKIAAMDLRFRKLIQKLEKSYQIQERRANDHFIFLEKAKTCLADADLDGLKLLKQVLTQEETLTYSGVLMATRSAPAEGSHQRQGVLSSSQMMVGSEDILYAYVLLDPADPASEIMLRWQTEDGAHQAFWGEDLINWPNAVIVASLPMGPLPARGEWVCLEVPAKAVGLEDKKVLGFAMFNDAGRAYWDIAGTCAEDKGKIAWVEEGLKPAGVLGRGWDWLGAAPYAGGTLTIRYFGNATEPFAINRGDSLYIDVFFDPDAPSEEFILQWYCDGWDHRSYWGKNLIPWGENDSPGRYYVGPLPAAGQWGRLVVPAEAIGLAGKAVHGVGVVLYNGRCFGQGLGKLSADGVETNWLADGLPKGAVLEGLGEGWLPWIDPSYEALDGLLFGYIAELQQDIPSALIAYDKLFTEQFWEPVTQAALLRVAAISLAGKDYDNALLAYQCLAEQSLEYQPHYANLLARLGDKQAAAEIYSQYMALSPDDLNTMLILGRLYLEMQVPEAAKIAFNYVLEEDPLNQAAQTLLKELEGTC